MEASTTALYLDFDERRKKQEALSADQADEAELKSIEAKLKRRPKSQSGEARTKPTMNEGR